MFLGCTVIGFAGNDDKLRWLKEDLGYDHVFNYKTVNVFKTLKEVAPKGVNCYFDNVGIT
jgi:prostaglandin reductase 1